MQYYLRFQCYDTPSRQTCTQIHPDIAVKDHPFFGYGQIVRVGDDAEDSGLWPQYVVANITHMKQIQDPASPDQNALLFQVFLIREEDWEGIEIPDAVEQVLEAEQRKASLTN